MCGVAGLLNFNPEAPVDPELLRRMCDALAHRGPDEEGFHLNGAIGLGSRRLKIIDLVTGQQPIHNEDRTVWTVFNGEIYNYRELRAELEGKGHRFYTGSDTECIVHLYEEHGDDFVQRLRGMFAIALWDTRRKRLVLARDRAGIKQLYYRLTATGLTFASEIKSLLLDPAYKRAIDLPALRDFLVYQYVPGARTIFEGVRRLPPAHLLAWEAGRCSISRYWELQPAPRPNAPEEEVVEEFRERFTEAVRLRLISDVPLGAFLSGGIDSSAVLAVMAGLSSQPVKTFTIGYEAERVHYDERPYARLVARRFGADHHEFVVRPQIEEIVPDIIRSFDEPFADSSAIPNYYISKLTRQHVTVALSGLGGDEIAGGYERYLGVLLAEHYRRIPRAIREGLIAPIVRRLPDSRTGALGVERSKRFIGAVECPLEERYQRYLSAFTPEEMGTLLSRAVREELAEDTEEPPLAKAFRGLSHLDPVAQMLFCDFATYLPDDLLVLTDRMSMAHSLEVRVPFLDHPLLEFVATVPSSLKIRGWTKKYLLKKAFSPLLPREILTRRKKGFSMPLAVWLRGALRPFLLDYLSPARLRRTGYFNPTYVASLVDEHLSRRQNHEKKLWALLIFSIWHDLYMNGSPSR